MPGKAPGRRTLALLLVALLAGAAPLAWAPEAEGQGVVHYEAQGFDSNVRMYPRPDGYSIGCTDEALMLENTGTTALPADVLIYSNDAELLPGISKMNLALEESRYVPFCVVTETDSKSYIIEVTAKTPARESNIGVPPSEWVNFKLFLNFTDPGPKKPDRIYVFEDISAFALSANGGSLGVSERDGSNTLFSLIQSPSGYRENRDAWEMTGKVNVISLAAEGKIFAAGSDTGWIGFFENTSADPLWTADLGSPISSLELSANGAYLAAGTVAGSLSLFARDNATARWTHAGNGSVEVLAITGDGTFIAAGFASGNLSLFGPDSATPRWTHAAGSAVRTLAMSADGTLVAAGDASGNVSLFGPDSATPIWTHALGGAVNEVAMSADGVWIAAGAADGNVSLFRRASAVPQWRFATGAAVASVSMSADGRYISAGAGDKVLLLDRESSAEFWNYTAAGTVREVQLTADGEWLVVLADQFLLFYTDTHPIAVIDAPLPDVVAVGRPVTFRGHGAAYGPEREFIGYEWNSSIDGLLSTDAMFVTAGLSPGDHLISLRVQDADGEWSLPLTILLRVEPAPVEDDTGIAAPPLPLLLAALALAAARRRFR